MAETANPVTAKIRKFTRRKKLSPEAQRALAEAEARRKDCDQAVSALPKEVGGSKGPEPTRYGDWEGKGLAHDF